MASKTRRLVHVHHCMCVCFLIHNSFNSIQTKQLFIKFVVFSCSFWKEQYRIFVSPSRRISWEKQRRKIVISTFCLSSIVSRLHKSRFESIFFLARSKLLILHFFVVMPNDRIIEKLLLISGMLIVFRVTASEGGWNEKRKNNYMTGR